MQMQIYKMINNKVIVVLGQETRDHRNCTSDFYITKRDIIAMAKHFGLKEPDL